MRVESEQPAIDLESAGRIESKAPLAENKNRPVSRYQRDLDTSLKRIEGQDKNRGTIQIMMIGIDSLSDGAYHGYLEKLKLNKINIYQTIINNSVVYGVIFGDYESRRKASKNIKQLPDGLQAKELIPRSIGGISNEINNK